MSFHLLRPEWLWALLPALLLAVLLWQQRRRSGSWQQVIDPVLLPFLLGQGEGEGRGQRRPLVLLALWALACLAAAGPSFRQVPLPVLQKQDALVLVLDLSYSMVAADLAPSRVDRARQKLLDLLERRREGQTALVAYAGDAHVVTPLTDDVGTIANLLPALHPGMMPVPGSDPAAAVGEALQLLRSAGIRRGHILLVTDGIRSGDERALQRTLQGSDSRLSVLAVGTVEGAPLPLPRGGFLKDDAGNIVVPGLDEPPLTALAARHGGRYQRLAAGDGDLDRLLAEDPLSLAGDTRSVDRVADRWLDQGHWLVVLLLPAVLTLFQRGRLLALLPVLLLPLAEPGHAGAWDDLWRTRDQQGMAAMARQDYGAAAQLFENPALAGQAAYAAGDYPAAADHFGSGSGADDWYNHGNALARAGELEAAAAAYRESLARQPGQQDAQDNLALVESLLQQQQQQEQQDQQGDGGDDQQGEGDQQNDSDAGGGNGAQQPGGQQSPGGEQTPQRGTPNEDSADAQAGQQQTPRQPLAETGQQPEAQPDTGEHGTEGQMADAGDATSATAMAQDDQAGEREQSLEQWLRRVPDDPSGLLRQKFRYQSQLRQQQGEDNDSDIVW